jgi:hypothetical protein
MCSCLKDTPVNLRNHLEVIATIVGDTEEFGVGISSFLVVLTTLDYAVQILSNSFGIV